MSMTWPIGFTVQVDRLFPVPISSCQLPTTALSACWAPLTTEVPGAALQKLSARFRHALTAAGGTPLTVVGGAPLTVAPPPLPPAAWQPGKRGKDQECAGWSRVHWRSPPIFVADLYSTIFQYESLATTFSSRKL